MARALPHPFHRFQKEVMVLHRHQAAHDAHRDLIVRQAVHLAEQRTFGGLVLLEPAEVEAQGDHAHLISCGDPVLIHQLALLLFADGDDPTAAPGQEALDVLVHRRTHRAEVAVEDMSVERMHDGLHPQLARRHAAYSTGLRSMRMHDVRPEILDQPLDPPVGTPVAPGGHLTLHLRQDRGLHAQ